MVKVFHAGSLTGPFEKIKAEFEEKYPNTEVLLKPAGSVECVKKVTDSRPSFLPVGTGMSRRNFQAWLQ